MLPGLGFSEILVLGVIALLVVGPKDLPLLLRNLGRWTRKLQAMAAEFRQGFDELARQAELDELRREVEAMRRTAHAGLQTVVDDFQSSVASDPGLLEAPAPFSPDGAVADGTSQPLPELSPAPPVDSAATVSDGAGGR